jgi:hypothetical protein
MTDMSKRFFQNNWFNLATMAGVFIGLVYSFGYQKKDVDDKVNENTVREIVAEEITKQQEKGYIQINQVPGLNERLNAIESALKNNQDLTQKIYERLLK